MKRPQFHITDLLLLGPAAGMTSYVWIQYEVFEQTLSFATLIALFTVSLAVIFAEAIKTRPFMCGFAIYAALHIGLIMHFGFAGSWKPESIIGMSYALNSGVASRWALLLFTDTLRVDTPASRP